MKRNPIKAILILANQVDPIHVLIDPYTGNEPALELTETCNKISRRSWCESRTARSIAPRLPVHRELTFFVCGSLCAATMLPPDAPTDLFPT